MQRRTNQAIFSVLIMLTIWVVIHTVKLNTIVPDYTVLNKTVNTLMNRVIGVEEMFKELKSLKGELEYDKIYKKQLDSLTPFGERFNEMRDLYGPGHVFNWNERMFTTYYAEELVTDNNNQ